MEAKDRIICALDVDNAYRALQLVGMLREHVGVFKVGLELINTAGTEIIEKLHDAGASKISEDNVSNKGSSLRAAVACGRRYSRDEGFR